MDLEAIRKRTTKATLALRKSVVIAGRQEWITPEQSSILSHHILGFEQVFLVALPALENKDESEAELPF